MLQYLDLQEGRMWLAGAPLAKHLEPRSMVRAPSLETHSFKSVINRHFAGRQLCVSTMRLQTVVSTLLIFIFSLAGAFETERTVDIFAWPASAAKSELLAKVAFNSTAATVKIYARPTIPSGDDLVRVGFYHPSGSWSGIATAASNFAKTDKKLELHINSSGELYHVGFKAGDLGSNSRESEKRDGLRVEVLRVNPGPTPHLNKPVVMNPDGSTPEKEPEKTFLQKYWWAIAGFIVLQLVLSGGRSE